MNAQKEQWQLYDENGSQIDGQSAIPSDVLEKGLLHGASHVWIRREHEGSTQVLLQLRAPGKRSYPNRYDISAAGHIDLGEDPLQAAIRETREETGISINEGDLQLFSVERKNIVIPHSSIRIENEFNWVYLVTLSVDQELIAQQEEVSELIWKDLDEFIEDLNGDNFSKYVPHSAIYYQRVVEALQS